MAEMNNLRVNSESTELNGIEAEQILRAVVEHDRKSILCWLSTVISLIFQVILFLQTLVVFHRKKL